MNKNGMWIAIAVVVLVILGLWWWSASQGPVDTTINGQATTSAEGGEGAMAGDDSNAGPTGGSSPIPSYSGSGSVAAVVASIGGSSTFASWLSSTGVAAELTGAGPYTVFVPTDGAVSQLPSGTYSGLSAAEKKRFISYHVVEGRAIDADAQTAGAIQALSGDALNFSYGQNKIPMVNSAIVVASYSASNGIVYVIDNVLIPPQKTQ